eukprot:snap_masked-scaffold_9-processed-gene-10.49-mRNA-1 protein AED:0.42 eAED:1.00 QI:0/-1/0/1/-1/1/1/0/72
MSVSVMTSMDCLSFKVGVQGDSQVIDKSFYTPLSLGRRNRERRNVSKRVNVQNTCSVLPALPAFPELRSSFE